MNSRILLFIISMQSLSVLAGNSAHYPYAPFAITTAYLLLKNTPQFQIKTNAITDRLHKKSSYVVTPDRKKNSRLSHPANCPNGNESASGKSKGQTNSQSCNPKKQQQTGAVTQTGINFGASSSCGVGGDDPDPPKRNQETRKRECGVGSLPLPVWQSEEDENTIVFAVKTKKLLLSGSSQESDRTTPAAQIYIDGQPVIFYIRWGEATGAIVGAKPFLVARKPEEDSPDSTPKTTINTLSGLLYNTNSLNSMLSRVFTDTHLNTTLDDAQRIRALLPRNVWEGEINYLNPVPTRFTLAIHPTVYLNNLTIESDSLVTEAEASDPEHWAHVSNWTLTVTGANGADLLSLQEITFQDQANNFLWDGYGMDGLRSGELIDHLRLNHGLEVDIRTTEMEHLPFPPGCDYCERAREKNRQIEDFWNSLQVLLNSEDCPDELYFKVVITPRPLNAEAFNSQKPPTK
ncbi:hypothetical protein [Endozoicomonas euniceicola]|uniref:Uncharacterized protein n=1 Tax=Endozoicomonas euniceicola TaxID=1234143 RepID=A0ABY6GZY3_9GAMM|nr:hypothetical protein [Endozoicomonas euniceicola]UYM18344.1 hypothetical protein NX720_10685 [Endozoicomonas euniceicola]